MNSTKHTLSIIVSGLITLGVSSSALADSSFKFTPLYFANGGSSSFSSIYYSSNGKPLNLVAKPTCTLDPATTSNVIKLLPEGKAVPDNSPLLTDDAHANIYLTADANVQVSFVYEGAGYTNAVGFFNFPTANLATLRYSSLGDQILFPNFSSSGSGGAMNFGDTVDLKTIAKDTAIGFTLVSNGWKSGGVKTNRTINQIFRTVQALNPESTAAKKKHTVLLSDPNAHVLIIGIEDLNRDSCNKNDSSDCTDDDFNDVVLAVCVDPWSAIKGVETIKTIVPPVAAPLPGLSGPSNWQEINTTSSEVDPIKAQLSTQRAATITAPK
jgi:hypothetical protein